MNYEQASTFENTAFEEGHYVIRSTPTAPRQSTVESDAVPGADTPRSYQLPSGDGLAQYSSFTSNAAPVPMNQDCFNNQSDDEQNGRT
jgi:hypothetical protein